MIRTAATHAQLDVRADLTTVAGATRSPAWSPDGDAASPSRRREAVGRCNPQIVVANADGVESAARSATASTRRGRRTARRIAVRSVADAGGSNSDLSSMNADGTGVTQITLRARSPTASPVMVAGRRADRVRTAARRVREPDSDVWTDERATAPRIGSPITDFTQVSERSIPTGRPDGEPDRLRSQRPAAATEILHDATPTASDQLRHGHDTARRTTSARSGRPTGRKIAFSSSDIRRRPRRASGVMNARRHRLTHTVVGLEIHARIDWQPIVQPPARLLHGRAPPRPRSARPTTAC